MQSLAFLSGGLASRCSQLFQLRVYSDATCESGPNHRRSRSMAMLAALFLILFGLSARVVAQGFNIPYTMQVGAVRYAPMQRQPGSAITARTVSMQYPTSAFTLYTTIKGPPDAVTTTTMPWTYVVTSLENTASPVAAPSTTAATSLNAQQRYLRRWAD